MLPQSPAGYRPQWRRVDWKGSGQKRNLRLQFLILSFKKVDRQKGSSLAARLVYPHSKNRFRNSDNSDLLLTILLCLLTTCTMSIYLQYVNLFTACQPIYVNLFTACQLIYVNLFTVCQPIYVNLFTVCQPILGFIIYLFGLFHFDSASPEILRPGRPSLAPRYVTDRPYVFCNRCFWKHLGNCH